MIPVVEWVPDDLNEAIRPVADHLGIDVARRMVEVFGGMRIHVPKVWRPGHLLAALGEETATAFIRQFAGEVICVPKSLVTTPARVAKARALREAGHTVNVIARALGLSHRGAQEHLMARGTLTGPARRGRLVDDRQIDLEDLIHQSQGARRA